MYDLEDSIPLPSTRQRRDYTREDGALGVTHGIHQTAEVSVFDKKPRSMVQDRAPGCDHLPLLDQHISGRKCYHVPRAESENKYLHGLSEAGPKTRSGHMTCPPNVLYSVHHDGKHDHNRTIPTAPGQ